MPTPMKPRRTGFATRPAVLLSGCVDWAAAGFAAAIALAAADAPATSADFSRNLRRLMESVMAVLPSAPGGSPRGRAAAACYAPRGAAVNDGAGAGAVRNGAAGRAARALRTFARS